MRSNLKTINGETNVAEAGNTAEAGQGISRVRRVLLALAAAALLLLVAPVAAQATDQFSNNNSDSTFNGQTVNFGSFTQLNLPSPVQTMYLWTNTASGGTFNTGRRHIAVDVNLTGTAYEYVGQSGGSGTRNCGTNAGAFGLRLVMNYTGTGTKSCGFTFRLKAGIPDNATYNQAIPFQAAPNNNTNGGCNGPSSGTANCSSWSGGTSAGTGNFNGSVVANINSADIRDTGNANTITSYDFDERGTGTTTSYTAVLRNTGNTLLTNANSIGFTGANASEFSQTNTCPATLGVGATCNITVTYAPTVPGPKSASLDVSTGNAGTISLGLVGSALAPTFIPVIQDTAGAVPLAAYAFPASVPVGEPFFPTYVFTLRNDGNSTLTGGNIQALSGADAADFTRTSTCGASLAPNATCTITVGLNPGTVGSKNATLEVNTTNGGSTSVALSGTAVAGLKETTIQNTAGDTNLPAYTFPDTIALNSASYVFTIRNTGNTNLQNVGTQSITGADADQFARTTNCGAVLAPNGTCTVTVTYNPTRVQAGMSASLEINPSNGGASSIPLTATSLTPSPQLSIRNTGDTANLTSQGFSANLGGSQQYVFTIKNTGDSVLNGVTTQTVTGVNASEFSRTTTCGASLVPGAACTTTVTFAPTRAGTRRAVLTVSPTNPIVAPAAKTVNLIGEATGVAILNNVTDNIANTGSQKRWLESVSLAPGGTIASDTVRVAFKVDAGTANTIAGVDIVGNTTTNDTAPTSNFQDIESLTLGRVDVQRKPGSNQALVVAQVPLSSTSMGVANGSYGFSTGTDIVIACFGGSFENTNRRFWFRVRAADGSTSATVGSVVRLHNQQYACPNNQGPNISNQRILSVGGTNLPNGTTVAPANKNQPATFQFTTRAKTAGALGGSDGTVDGINWRIRNVETGDMFRIVNGNYTACADPCTADANFNSGGRFNFADNAAGVQQLTIPGIPSRGRWVVEGAPQGSDENDDSHFFIGTLLVNDRSGTSPTLSFGGSLGPRPDSNADYTISAAVSDPADPASAFDTQGGRAQVIEWDLNGIPDDGADGQGFEVRGETDASGTLTAEDLVQEFSTIGKTPGPYTIRARVTDNGAIMASDDEAVSRIFVFNTTINSPPVGTTETVSLEADDPQPGNIEFRATDENGDPYKVAITPNPANDGTIGGNLNGPIGDNTKPYTWPATYTGTDSFDFITTDDKNGVSGPATLTVKVRPNTTIDLSTIGGALLNPDLGNPGTRFLGSTTATAASFDFSSPQTPVVAYECRLLNDGSVISDWAECSNQSTGSIAFTGLDDGLHRLEVRAVNADGDADGTPAFRTWRVDNTAPVTEVRVGPPSDLPNQQPRMTNDTTPSYIFRATADERSLQQYVTYECRVLFGPESGVWQPCGAPSDTQGSGVVDIVGPTPDFGLTDPLAEGTYSMEVRATDEVGNLGPVLNESFLVDTTPPITALASGPEGLVNTRDLEYVVSSTEGQSTFTCKLERVEPDTSLTSIFAWGPCPGPAADGSRPTFTVPTDGNYVLSVIATDPATNPDPTPLEVEFEVDATEPTTTLDPQVDFGSGPTLLRRTQSRKVDVTFTGADTRQLSGFQCRIDSTDDADWNLCQSVQRFSGLSDGDHVLEIRSRDEAGNFDSTPEVLEWTVDRTPPTTSITTSPDAVSNDNVPSVEFAVNETASSQCRLDGGAWTACSSPVAVADLNGGDPLADGPHTFSVRSTDLAGNVEVTAASVSWTVDTTVPVIELTSKPNLFVPRGDASFAWLVKDGSPLATSVDATSECSLDSAPFAPCDRSLTVTDPANGPHTLVVRATDQAGNVSPDESYTFEVLGSPPAAPSIDNSDPADGTVTRLKTAGFAFSHPREFEAGFFGGYECRIDTGAWAACESPVSLDALTDGQHSFQLRARDVADNISPAVSVDWEVQSGAPFTTIDNGPSGVSNQATATLSFSSDKAGTFECRIDGAAWAACESPLALSDLTDGEHSVRVRAVSSVAPVGVKDPTPALRTWSVDTVAPDVTIDSAPSGALVTGNATLTFSSTDPSAAFQCKVGSGLFDACSSPLNLSGLQAGEITVTVRAIDAAGNLSATPATALWTVENPTCPDGQEGTPPNCTDIPPVNGPGINATLTGGELSLATLGSVPLPAGLATLNGRRASDGRWYVPREGVAFESVTQTIPDVLGPGSNVDVIISISATGAGRGTLPTAGGPATFVLPVRADVQAKLGPVSVIPPGTECSLKPLSFNLSGTYDPVAKTVSLSSPAVAFPKVTGCASFKETIDTLLELPRDDIALSMDFDLVDVVDNCPTGQIGTPPNCVTPVSKLKMGKVRGPKRIKGGKAITLSSKITNSGQADATGVKVCLSSPKKLVKGKATTCRTIAKIAAGKSVTVKFRVVTRKARKSARAKFRLSTTWKSQGATKKNYVGHVTLIKQ
jgi:hypothetical protein